MKIREIKTVMMVYIIIIVSGMYFNEVHINKIEKENQQKLNNEIVLLNERIQGLEEGLESMNLYVEDLERKIPDFDKLYSILKDLASSWSKK